MWKWNKINAHKKWWYEKKCKKERENEEKKKYWKVNNEVEIRKIENGRINENLQISIEKWLKKRNKEWKDN